MKTHIKFVVAVLVLCACTFLVYRDSLFRSPNGIKSNSPFPSEIADWTAHTVVYDTEMLQRELSPDTMFICGYTNEEAFPPITLFIAYYNSLEKADLSHSPIVCFTGQGWHIDERSELQIPVGNPGSLLIKVNELIENKQDIRIMTLYWHQSASRVFANRGIQKLSLFLSRIQGKPTDNAFVRLTLTMPPGKTIEEMRAHLIAFVQDLYPKLNQYLL